MRNEKIWTGSGADQLSDFAIGNRLLRRLTRKCIALAAPQRPSASAAERAFLLWKYSGENQETLAQDNFARPPPLWIWSEPARKFAEKPGNGAPVRNSMAGMKN